MKSAVNLMPLEELNFAFVLLRSFPCPERPEIAALTGLGVLLARIQAILSRLELSNHRNSISRRITGRKRLVRSDIDDVAVLGVGLSSA
jgi:hypothetical protein